jgi:hypothetical protein
MTKSSLKKQLQTLSRVQLIQQVLSLYDTYKPVKEYFEYSLSPNEKEQFEKYKAVIVNEFYPNGKYSEPKTRFAMARKGIADFSKLNPSQKSIGDLMVTFAEMACKSYHSPDREDDILCSLNRYDQINIIDFKSGAYEHL